MAGSGRNRLGARRNLGDDSTSVGRELGAMPCRTILLGSTTTTVAPGPVMVRLPGRGIAACYRNEWFVPPRRDRDGCDPT
jgi:hypothetical protein